MTRPAHSSKCVKGLISSTHPNGIHGARQHLGYSLRRETLK
jgi:hypothetical protein